jgi:Flp pilus assembly protein TadG
MNEAGAVRRAGFVREDSGAAVVEFAITLTMLLILVFGIVDFGRALFTMNNLTQAAREGARYGAVSNGMSEEIGIKDTTIAHAAALGGAALTRADITVTATNAGGTLQYMRVQINYTFVPITPIASLIGLGNIPLSPSAVFRWERAG